MMSFDSPQFEIASLKDKSSSGAASRSHTLRLRDTSGYGVLPQHGIAAGRRYEILQGQAAVLDLEYREHYSNEFWQSRGIWRPTLKNISRPWLVVGGWYDQEDPQGPLRQFHTMQQDTPPQNLTLVMGPWNHGGFARGTGDKLGSLNFGSNTSQYFREKD